MKELILRIKMETPPFFKRLAAILVTIGGVCSTALAGEAGAENFLNVTLYPDWAGELLKLGAFGGLVGFLIARLAVCNPEKLYQKLNEPKP